MSPGEYNGVVLKGYAGTGKTYLVKRIIEYASIADPKHKEAITAPTNKAVHVLHKNSPLQIIQQCLKITVDLKTV